MSDELNNPKPAPNAGETHPTPSGATNSTPKLEDKTIPTPITQPSELEARKLLKMPIFALPWIEKGKAFWKNRWTQLVWKAVVRLGVIASAVVTLLWTLALWDSYRPKITVTPGPTFSSTDPFGTVFIIQNQGALYIRNVSFNLTWTYADANLPVNPVFGLTKIPEMKSLEQHALLTPPLTLPPEMTTNHAAATQAIPMPFAHHSLVLWFDITYDPQFFGRRTETVYFLGSWDSGTNFQWLPTGHTDIRWERTDAHLLARAIEIERSIERSHEIQPTNNPLAAPAPNSGPVNAAPNVKVGSGSKVHTP